MDEEDAVRPTAHRGGPAARARPPADRGGPAVTAPRTGDTGVALPGTPREWLIATGRISGLSFVLMGAEMSGGELPEPLGRRSARAWGRLVRALGEPPSTRVLPAADLDVLGAVARALGRELCRYRVSGAVSATVTALLDEAAVHGTSPEQLVAQVARVHGVLDSGPGPAADELWDAAG